MASSSSSSTSSSFPSFSEISRTSSPAPAPALEISLQDRIRYYLCGSETPLLRLLRKISHSDPKALSVLDHILGFHSQSLIAVLQKLRSDLLSDDSKVALLKPFLLHCLSKAPSREFVNVVVCQFAVFLEDWTETIPFLFDSFHSNSVSIQESALILFSVLASSIKSLDRDRVLDNIFLQAVFLVFLTAEPRPPEFKMAAIKATVASLTELALTGTHQSEEDQYRDLMVEITYTFSAMILQNHQFHAHQVLEEMSKLAETSPCFFKDRIKPLAQCLLGIVTSAASEDGLRSAAIGFIATVAQEPEAGRDMILKVPDLIKTLFSTFLIMLGTVEDDPSWHDVEGGDPKAGESSLYSLGVVSLDRITEILDESTVTANFPGTINDDLRAEEWHRRYAALTFIAITVHRCLESYGRGLRPLLIIAIKSIHDPHPLVRKAAINVIKECCKFSGPEWRDQYHQLVLPALTMALNDLNYPRVQMEAVLALQFFSTKCSSNILTPYLCGILSKLLILLQTGKTILKEEALTALASMASSSKEQCQEYYNIVMPYLKVILYTAEESECMLLGKSLSCITIFWLYVGKEKFRDDMQQVVKELIIPSQESQLEAEGGPFRKLVLEAWGRLCKSLGQEFQPYTSVAIPCLLRSAQHISFGGILDDKATACNVLCCCAAELKEDFYPWIHEAIQTLVPLLRVDADVRAAAVAAMPVILQSSESAKEKGYLQGFHECPFENLSSNIIPSLVRALQKEPLEKIRLRILDSLNECLQISEPLKDENFMSETIKILTATWLEATGGEKGDQMDIDEGKQECLEEKKEHKEEYYDKAIECCATFMKAYNVQLFPFSAQIFECVVRIGENDKSAKVRRIVMHMFHDVAEKFTEDTFRDFSFHLLFRGCHGEKSGGRQVAAYAIGVCAEFGGDWFKPHIEEALSSLNSVIWDPKTSAPGHALARDFAVSALGKICQFHGDSINAAEQAFNTWLHHLPMKSDIKEAKTVHDELCSMVEKSDSLLLGPNNSNLRKIIEVFAEILCASLATEQTVMTIIILLKNLRGTLLPATWDLVFEQRLPSQGKRTSEGATGASMGTCTKELMLWFSNFKP